MGTQLVAQGPMQRLYVSLIVSGLLPVALVVTTAILRPEAFLWVGFWGRLGLSWAALALIAFLVLPGDTSPAKLRLKPEWRAAILVWGWQLHLAIGLGALVIGFFVFAAAPPRGLIGMLFGVIYLVVAFVSYRRGHRTGSGRDGG